eukprot:5234387-Pleurochrysis_carterae.AAC.1
MFSSSYAYSDDDTLVTLTSLAQAHAYSFDMNASRGVHGPVEQEVAVPTPPDNTLFSSVTRALQSLGGRCGMHHTCHDTFQATARAAWSSYLIIFMAGRSFSMTGYMRADIHSR